MNFSALLKVLFSVTAFVGSAGYFVLFCYALVLSALMADVCEGNLLPLLGYVLRKHGLFSPVLLSTTCLS